MNHSCMPSARFETCADSGAELSLKTNRRLEACGAQRDMPSGGCDQLTGLVHFIQIIVTIVFGYDACSSLRSIVRWASSSPWPTSPPTGLGRPIDRVAMAMRGAVQDADFA